MATQFSIFAIRKQHTNSFHPVFARRSDNMLLLRMPIMTELRTRGRAGLDVLYVYIYIYIYYISLLLRLSRSPSNNLPRSSNQRQTSIRRYSNTCIMTEVAEWFVSLVQWSGNETNGSQWWDTSLCSSPAFGTHLEDIVFHEGSQYPLKLPTLREHLQLGTYTASLGTRPLKKS